jgi:hypothetical protein
MSAHKLGSFGLNTHLTGKLGQGYNVTPLDNIPAQLPSIDFLLVDYPVKEDIENYKKISTLLKHYVPKKVLTVILDNHLSIAPEEIDWLKRGNVRLFEPAIRFRKDFDYLPMPIKTYNLESMVIDDRERPVTLGHIGLLSDRVKAFEYYYVEPAKIYPSIKVRYNKTIDKAKKDEYALAEVHQNIDMTYADMKYMVAIGSQRDYNIGYLNPHIFEAMENNCIPLLPYQHKYFHALFSDTLFMDKSQLIWFNDSYESLYLGVIANIYGRIEELYPEFTISHWCDTIKHTLK